MTSSLAVEDLTMTDSAIQGDHDVLASTSDTKLERKGYRAFAKRGVHLANFVPWIECPSKEQ